MCNVRGDFKRLVYRRHSRSRDIVHEANVKGLCSVECSRREDKPLCFGQSQQAGQTLCSTSPWDYAQPCLWEANLGDGVPCELSVRVEWALTRHTSNPEITCEGKLEATTERGTVDSREGGERKVLENG